MENKPKKSSQPVLRAKHKAKKIILYTTPTCTYCHMVKQFFKENKVNYEEIDVTKDKRYVDELLKKSGQLGVPVTDISGTIIVGFDREALKQALKKGQ